MKVSEIDFTQYQFERIAVLRHGGVDYCPKNAVGYVKKEYGEKELADEDAVTVDADWLTLKLAESVKK